MNRTDGYITDVSYPAFFHKEMQPVWLASVARFLGFSAPEVTSPFSWCELGCGVGINLLTAAACHPDARFVGVDFNARNLQIARDAANASGLENIEFIHSDFEAFAGQNREQFDGIATHGVWSWIAPRHQGSLLECVASALKPGGLFYLHYMCHPGSTQMLEVQHFLNVFSHQVPGTSAQRMQAGLKLLRQLGDAGVFVDKPAVLAKLRDLENKDPNHLAHEFLTEHWRPQHSTEVHQQVGEVGLRYLGSAEVFNNLDAALSIPGRLQGVVNRIAVPAMVEMVKDMARDSHQRMDLFQREPQVLGRETQRAQLDAMVFGLLPDAPVEGPVSFSTPIGNIEGPREIVSPLLKKLASGPTSVADLAQLPVFSAQRGFLLQSLQLLMFGGIVHPLNPVQGRCGPAVQRLAQWFDRHAISLRLVHECATAVSRQVAAAPFVSPIFPHASVVPAGKSI